MKNFRHLNTTNFENIITAHFVTKNTPSFFAGVVPLQKIFVIFIFIFLNGIFEFQHWFRIEITDNCRPIWCNMNHYERFRPDRQGKKVIQ